MRVQEDAAVWIGYIDLEKFEFVDEGTVLHFPRTTGDCGERYCNVEGIQFIDEYASTCGGRACRASLHLEACHLVRCRAHCSVRLRCAHMCAPDCEH